MDRVRKITTQTVQSSTLIEVITALIIISTVFSLAIVIYLNVQRSGFYSQRLTSSMLMDEAFIALRKTKDYTDKEVEFAGVTLYQRVSMQTSSGLLFIKMEVRGENGKLLAEQKHLLYVPDNP